VGFAACSAALVRTRDTIAICIKKARADFVPLKGGPPDLKRAVNAVFLAEQSGYLAPGQSGLSFAVVFGFFIEQFGLGALADDESESTRFDGAIAARAEKVSSWK
jgi:hypothetical protein